jgi:hypothetical protein
MVMSALPLASPEHVRAVRDGLAASGLEGEVKLLGGGEDRAGLRRLHKKMMHQFLMHDQARTARFAQKVIYQ